MRVVVTGATGNVGTSVVAALGRDRTVTEIVGLARRTPDLHLPKVSWCRADVTTPAPAGLLRGAASPARRHRTRTSAPAIARLGTVE